MLVSLIEIVALPEPVAVGLKVAPMVQVACDATLAAQGFAGEREKSPAFVPAIAIPWMPSVEVPVLVRTVVCTGLVFPIATPPKFRLKGTSFALPVVTVTVEVVDFVLSDTEVTVIVTTGFAGSAAGAVYVVGAPLAVVEGVIVPHPGEHEPAPCVSVHVTPLLAGSFITVAVNAWVTLRGINALVGVSEPVIAGTVTFALLDAAGLNTEAALIVTGKLLSGGTAGPEYVVGTPLTVVAGEIVPQGGVEHATVHVTPWFCGS